MSDRGRYRPSFEGTDLRTRAAEHVFGDRVGLAAVLAAICLFSALWIVDWRINDSLTLLNALSGMGDGHLYLGDVEYGTSVETPGTHRVGDRVFGRNYGLLTASLVPLVLFDALSLVVDLRIAIAGCFSLAVLALAAVIGDVAGARDRAAIAGCVVALALFVGNVALATNLDPARAELYALQVTHMLGAALVVLFTYRLLAAVHGRRTGLFAAALVALGTPVGLWASVPKRHVFTAALAVGLAYALYLSRVRARESPGSGRRYRLGAYAGIGLFAWVHAPEALLALLVFAAVDLPTGARDLRSLASIGAVLGVATIPFLVTNYLVSGDPLTPPRMLAQAGAATGEPAFGGGTNGGAGSGAGLLQSAIALVDPILQPLATLFGLVRRGVDHLLYRSGEVWTTVVRSGYLAEYAAEADFESVNLAVLESAPVLAAVVGVVPAGVRAGHRRLDRSLTVELTPERTVDAFLVLFTVAFTLMYLSRLPIHAQITNRYLLPVFVTLVVLVVRLPAIRGVLDGHWRLLLWTYAVGVLIGGQLLVVALAVMDPAVGEAFQFHAWVGLATAVPLAVWSLVGRSDGWWGRVGAVSIALATAVVTVFLLLLALDYFTVGNAQALPLVRAVADVVSLT